MDDCISRTQAIDALRKMQTYKLFSGDDMLLIDQAEAQTELMMLPSAQPERKTGRWIPVEERLPEPWVLVLVTDSRKNVTMCQMALNPSDGWYDECENWMYFSTSVIAWTPLPEYYQEKDGEQE